MSFISSGTPIPGFLTPGADIDESTFNNLRNATLELRNHTIARGYDASFYGATGDGVADDRAALDTLANVVIPITGGRLLLSGTGKVFKIASSLTIPANVELRVEHGAKLQIDNGATLTINGKFVCGLSQAFQWTGTGAVVFASGSIHHVLPEWWGAKGDNTTDDRLALNACVAPAAAAAVSIRLTGKYRVSSPGWVIAADYVAVEGTGWWGNTMVRCVGDGAWPAISVQSSSTTTNRTGVRFYNFHIYGQLQLIRCVEFSATDVVVRNGYTHSCYIQAGYIFHFTNCYFLTPTDGYYAVYMTSIGTDPSREVNAIDFLSCRIEGPTGLGGIGSDALTKIQNLNWKAGVIESFYTAGAWGVSIPYGWGFTLIGTYFEALSAGNIHLGSATTIVEGVFIQAKNSGYGDGHFTPRTPVGIWYENVRGAVTNYTSQGFSGPSLIVEDRCRAIAPPVISEATSVFFGDTSPVIMRGQHQHSGLDRVNIARNGTYEQWNAGVTLPQHWYKNAGTETIARAASSETSGSYVVQLTNAAASSGGMGQAFDFLLPSLKGKRIFFGVMAKCSDTNRFRIRVSDGVQSVSGQSLIGDGTYRQVGNLFTVSATATQLRVVLELTSGTATTVELDDFVAIVGGESSADRFGPSIADLLKHHTGVATTAGSGTFTATVAIKTDSDSYRVQLTPASNVNCWVTGKTGTQFTINTSAAATVDWQILPDAT